MFIQRKNYLSEISRIRVAEGRNLKEGLRLDRNEKVDVWPKDLLSKIFAEQPDYFLSVYPEPLNLYAKLAAFHDVSESELLLTSGIDGGLKTLFEVMTHPGDLVGVVAPTYAMYSVYAKLFQVNLEEIVYTPDLKFDYQRFDSFINKKPVMFFLPNPNQPIESAFTLKELEQFALKTFKKHCLFVIDEAYHLFGCDSGVNLIEKYENVVVARTFSKGFGVPSIRLGYLISNKENMNILAKTRFAHEGNALTYTVAEYLLDHYSIVENYNAKVIATRENLKSILNDIGIQSWGTAGNFLLLDLKEENRARSYVETLRTQKIYVKGPWNYPWNRYVTITIGPMDVMLRFVDATANFISSEKNR